MTSSSTRLSSDSSLTYPRLGAVSTVIAVLICHLRYRRGCAIPAAPRRCPRVPDAAGTLPLIRTRTEALLSDELVPEEIEPDAEPDVAGEPDVGYGQQDEAAQEQEWEEDAEEGGA